MEAFLIGCLLLFLMIRWLWLNSRLTDMEARLDALESRAPQTAPAPPPVTPPPAPAPRVTLPLPPPLPPPVPRPIIQQPPPPPPPPLPAPPRPTRDWETVFGGNWLNKLGVFLLVIGLALALGYSFTHIGPLGRVLISLAVSAGMLAAGVVLEPRETYRIFARGLLGGGWAALYVTVYAMHHIAAARVIESPVAGVLLLLAVAAGMIAHSLRYRSETVTAIAYFVAFGTLALTEVTALPLLALLPLAITLLYIAHRFSWTRMVPPALIFTYAICLYRGDSGSPLWQAQILFAAYWLLFEVFDILHPSALLLPLNAAGFLGLSFLKWQADLPNALWIFLAAAAAAYLADAIVRWRSGKWHSAATLAAALAAAAIFQRLDHQWVPTALAVEAELLYLAGIRLRAPWLRWLSTSLFTIEIGRLLIAGTFYVPVASFDAVLFYANRALCATDTFYGFAGAGIAALVIGHEVADPYRSIAWLLLAAATFSLGYFRRLFDFRLQGYFLGMLGVTVALSQSYWPPLALAAIASYSLYFVAARLEDEREPVQLAAALTTVATLATLAWRVVPGQCLGIAWLALSVLLLELGLRRPSYALALCALARLSLADLAGLHNYGPWLPRALPAAAAALCYTIALRARDDENGKVRLAASSAGTIFVLVATWSLLPAAAVGPAWAVFALALTLADVPVAPGIAALAFGRACLSLDSEASMTALTVAAFYGTQLLLPQSTVRRNYYCFLGTALTTLLLAYQISGSLLTVAWGIEGLALLAAGFPLRDRTLRLSGLALLMLCISKLFLWDLRHLDTLPRIFSFIVLGLILVGVSWIYTRFREHVARYL